MLYKLYLLFRKVYYPKNVRQIISNLVSKLLSSPQEGVYYGFLVSSSLYLEFPSLTMCLPVPVGSMYIL